MNLNDTEDGMVPLYQPPAPKPVPPKVPEKNIPKQQTKMDSTPIADIMQDSVGMMDAQDPRAQFMNTSNYMPQPPMMAPGSSPQAKPKKDSGNPLNLTDEQMSALVAGVCAIIAFSGPIQDKLSTTVPQFLSEAGSRSTTGLVVSGLLAAIIFFFAQRFLNK
jgi:hypothetical protein